MARITAGIGLPHVPFLPALVLREGAISETGQLFAQVREAMAAIPIDLIVEFSTDHLNTFFFDNLPIFGIGVADRFTGPNDEVEGVPVSKVLSDRALAEYLRRAAVSDGFDTALVQEFSVDHSFSVPLHFTTPDMTIPVIPVFINGHIAPLPSARRCYALGQSLGRAVRSYGREINVAFMGSGSFSLEVLGPLMFENRPYGIPDPAWAERIKALMVAGEIEQLLQECTPEQIHKAGNVGGELFNWLAMLGAIGELHPDFVQLETRFGHAYGVWR